MEQEIYDLRISKLELFKMKIELISLGMLEDSAYKLTELLTSIKKDLE